MFAMHGVFLEELSIGEIKIEGREHQHLRVKRIKKGETLFFTDGRGNYGFGVLLGQDKKGSLVRIDKLEKSKRKKELYAGLSVIEQQRAEIAVEKLTELGIAGIFFFYSKRSEKRNLRKDRLNKIAVEAIKQSKNPFLPRIEILSSIEEVLERFKSFKNKYFLDFGGEKFSDSVNTGVYLVGPEGGWTEKEKKIFEENSLKKIGLGENVLRAETAAISFASFFMLS
ncbi:MAG: 16S rRNA (uracil(1498)-N(3))-methyltransferase [Candidatus Aminicenantes bacterium]|nr:16S rRNA (uracil(1498)-N(3))-methyltransferase [Candidatus Aminicenantes bacterium]